MRDYELLRSVALRYVAKRMEEKLRELMGEEEYAAFSREIAKEVDAMAEGDFKDFCQENFDQITRDVLADQGEEDGITWS